MNETQQLNQDREIRVFISSTFRDMKAERDYLVKFTFPQLRRLCESRGVTWGDVDLRWGVTDEEAAEGKVLPICLEEIRRCRPWFIGLLGERYGWVPQHISNDLIEQQPWLKQHRHRSVTELEIIHGVLRNAEMHRHACFYFRDPSVAANAPTEQKADFTDEKPELADNLRRLKNEIRHARDEQVCQLREMFTTPEQLGAWVLEDFTRIINDRWPAGPQLSALERERLDHEACARTRAQVYIGREEYFQQLDTHVATGPLNDAPSRLVDTGNEGLGGAAEGIKPLVIIGESGSGKSALLASWALRYQQAHPDALIVQHYIGASPQSAEWPAMLRRIIAELKDKLGLQGEIPSDPQKLREAFANWLCMAAAQARKTEVNPAMKPSKIVIVLDALNQLEGQDGALDLGWLPPVMPDNVRLLVSTLLGRALEETRRRQWPEILVQPLTMDERQKLIAKYLGNRSRKLNEARRQRIAAAPQSANPLYLCALLDELCVTAENENLDARIDHYLQAPTPTELYKKVIERWESDYSSGCNLVRDALSLLWASRHGLSEAELLEALGDANGPLPHARWSPLYLAMGQGLMSRNGLLTFTNRFVRRAAQESCLATEEKWQKAHLRLADYFQSKPGSPRRAEELPWHLAEAKAWQRLHDLLAEHSFLKAAWAQNRFDVSSWWSCLEAGSALRMVMTYAKELEHPESEPDKNYLQILVSLLAGSGHLVEAAHACEHLVGYYQNIGEWDEFPRMLSALASLLRLRGDLDQAMRLHRDGERIARRVGNLQIVVAALLGQALILRDRGDWDAAMSALQEHERISRLSGDDGSLAAGQGVQALIMRDRGDLDGAMALHHSSERIARQSGDLDGLQVALNNQAVIMARRGDLDGAMALFKEQERICRRLGNLKGLAQALTNEGSILRLRGNLHEAMALQEQAERACRQLNYPDCLQSVLAAKARILKAGRNPDGALALLMESEQICRRSGNLDGLQSSLGDHALILLERRDFQRAKPLLDEQERICRHLRHATGLVTALAYQAGRCGEQGHIAEGLRYAEEACQIAASHGEESLIRMTERLRKRFTPLL